MGKTVTCAFCCKGRRSAEEHPLSQPLHRCLPASGEDPILIRYRQEGHDKPPVELARYRPKKDKRGFAANFVCSECNNGWMNDLDQEVAGLLCPMIKGEETVLMASAQLQISSWATKFALTIEAMFRDSQVPADVYTVFYDKRQPILGQVVHLGRYLGTEDHIFGRRPIYLSSYAATQTQRAS
jgi:hypothetical protein